MAQGVTISVQGLDKVLASIEKLGPEIQQKVDREFQAAALETQGLAVRNAPGDEGLLRQSITVNKVLKSYEVVVGRGYGPFMEFGTKGNFRALPGFEGYAAQFRNQKYIGPNVNPIDALAGWVHRKGLVGKGKGKNAERGLAFVIFRSIKKKGVKPHPFLLPAFVQVRRGLITRIVNIVKEAVKK